MNHDLGTPLIRVEAEGPLAWCVIERAYARNAFTPAMYYGLKRAGRLDVRLLGEAPAEGVPRDLPGG